MLPVIFQDNPGGIRMTSAIETMRRLADECERRAKIVPDKGTQADLIDLATRCQWLASNAELLNQQTLLEFA
jgi:hypothetical protein